MKLRPLQDMLQNVLRDIPRKAGRKRRSSPEGARTPLEEAALRAAVLLRSGMPAIRVWQVLGSESPESPQLVEIARKVAAGTPVPAALAAADAPAWRTLAAAWQIAETSGAPLSPALEQFAAGMRALDRVADRREVLLSGPRSTIRLVAALPPLALLLGAGLGFDPLPVILTPGGVILAAAGVLLLVLGTRWAQALVRRAAAADRIAGWTHELCGIALGGGGSSRAALRLVADCSDSLRAEWVRLAELRRDGAVAETLAVAAAMGSPAGPLLRGAAENARNDVQSELEREAERLAIRVLIPMGLCVLPSFVLLGVVPVLIAVLGGVRV